MNNDLNKTVKKRGRPFKIKPEAIEAPKVPRKRSKPPTTGQFKTGNPGNPNATGRPPIPQEIKDAIRLACPDAIKYLIGLVNDPEANGNLRVKASEILLDRGFCKPSQEIEVSGVIGLQIVWDTILQGEFGTTD